MQVSSEIDKLLAQTTGLLEADPSEREMERMTREALGGFVQIGGDADPWAYGGTWANGNGDIVHFDGLSEKEWQGTDAQDPVIDSMVTPADYLRIAQALKLDTDEKWEDVENEAREAHAEVFNAARKFQVYRTTDEPDAVIEKDWADDIAEIKASMDNGEELWAGMTPAQKIAALADYKGWYEFDYDPQSYTKAELETYLGIKL